MRQINFHIIHCSDSEFGDVKRVRSWHIDRGFKDVGYHFIIRRDGEIEVGRMLTEIGAHAKSFNYNSVGTCLIGKNNFTPEQFKSLKKLNDTLKNLFPNIIAKPHNYFNEHKACPNFDILSVL